MSERRQCACGCGQSLEGRSHRAIYFDSRCKQRAHQKRLDAAAKAAGVPARVSLKTLQTITSTGNGQSDRQRGARRRKPQPRPGQAVTIREPARLAAAIAALEYGQSQLGGADASSVVEDLRRAKARHEKRAKR